MALGSLPQPANQPAVDESCSRPGCDGGVDGGGGSGGGGGGGGAHTMEERNAGTAPGGAMLSSSEGRSERARPVQREVPLSLQGCSFYYR